MAALRTLFFVLSKSFPRATPSFFFYARPFVFWKKIFSILVFWRSRFCSTWLSEQTETTVNTTDRGYQPSWTCSGTHQPLEKQKRWGSHPPPPKKKKNWKIHWETKGKNELEVILVCQPGWMGVRREIEPHKICHAAADWKNTGGCFLRADSNGDIRVCLFFSQKRGSFMFLFLH